MIICVNADSGYKLLLSYALQAKLAGEPDAVKKKGRLACNSIGFFAAVGSAVRHHTATPARPDGPGAAAPAINAGARRRHTRTPFGQIIQP